MNAPHISPWLAGRIMANRQPDEVIQRDGNPLFERWWLLRSPSDGEAKGGNIYLHRWLRSDAEDPHCHPWWNETTVLVGRLVEDLFCPARIRLMKPQRRELTAGMTALRDADAIHRIVEIDPGTVTLFITGAKTRDWGFYPRGAFVPWRDYHGLPAQQVAA